MSRNILRGYPVALKGTGNRVDTKVSEPIEPDLYKKKGGVGDEGNFMPPSVHFPVIVESGSKCRDDAQSYLICIRYATYLP